jgi:16S rRNA (guanine527-N7)-methyltransferase
VRDYFGDAWTAVAAYAEFLDRFGPERGLIGPHERERLWSRHILNSAAVSGFLPESGCVIDLGSGGGLPGIVLAAMRRDLVFELVEPMERRCVWLDQVVEVAGLGNVRVTRARAEELDGAREVDAVVVRAVGAMDRVARWSGGLLRDDGGRLLALKGRRAGEELTKAAKALRKAKLVDAVVHEVVPLPGMEPTYVVEATRRA